MKRLMVLSFLILAVTAGAWSQQIKIPILVFDDYQQSDTMTLFFGFDPAATRGIDSSFGEYELPPPCCWDVRWTNSELGGGSPVDYRFDTTCGRMVDTFTIAISNTDYDKAGYGLMWDSETMKKYIDSIVVKIPAGTDTLGNPVPARKVDMHVFDSVFIPSALASGIRKFTILTLRMRVGCGDASVHEQLPLTYSLSTCYPNPFNPSTEIRYSLPQAVNVSLRVYDILGQEVRMLAEGFEQAGEKTVTFSAGDLPSGVYFYRLQAGSFTETKKLVLLR